MEPFCKDPAVEVVFHDADYDLRLLHQDYGWHVTNIFDTRIASQLLGIKSFGLAALLEQFFDVKLDKKHQRADWSMRPLTPDMLDYAAQDTRYLLDLRDELRSRLEKLGRLEWAREEFDRLEGTKWDPDDGSQAFLRIKGARDLTRRELALLRELVPWRDSVAREPRSRDFQSDGQRSSAGDCAHGSAKRSAARRSEGNAPRNPRHEAAQRFFRRCSGDLKSPRSICRASPPRSGSGKTMRIVRRNIGALESSVSRARKPSE